MFSKSLATTALTVALAFGAFAPISHATTVLVRSDGIYLRCSSCGIVQDVQQETVEGRHHGTLGSILGTLAGAVLGNQIGRGGGRTLATVAGGALGGVGGHAIGSGGGGTRYTVNVKMTDGSIRELVVDDLKGVRPGSAVQVDGNKLALIR